MNKEQRKIKTLLNRISSLGPLLPGSISVQYNVCGKSGCKCKDPKHPVKHGPYYQLSFTIGGRSSSLFLKKDDLKEARRRIKAYQKFRNLSQELVYAYIQLARIHGLK